MGVARQNDLMLLLGEARRQMMPILALFGFVI
jgi:hypothetical protein